MEQRFGNVTLGEINEMLISFIGKDMYFSFWEKENPKESIDAYKKHLNRLLKEDDKVDLSALCLSDERSVAKFVFEKILPDLQKTYFLSVNLCKFMKDFVYSLYDRFTQNDMPILDYCSNFDSFRIQDYFEQAQQKYNLAFEKIRERYKSLENFYESFDNDGTIKNTINTIRGHAKNPTWNVLSQMLKEITEDKQISALLIDAYILFNIYNSLYDNVKTNVIINIQYDATNMINSGIQYFFGDHGYKTDESRGNDILKTIEGQCPEAAEFYCNWFRGYHCVAKGELDDAKEYYIKAFAARRFAGCQFETFIKQAFVISCYLGFKADTVRNSADPTKDSQTPLSADAKKFWNYGYAAGIFEQKAEDTHQIVFRRVENLLKSFGTKMFFENSVFYSELLIEQFNVIPKDEKIFKDEYDILSSLKVDDINRCIRFVGTRQTKNLPIVVALFCIEGCYSFGYADLAKKFIALLKEWLDNFDLDLSLCSGKGCSIVCDAIQQYKKLKLHHLDLDLTELKRIVLRIIDKSNEDSLTRASLQKKRCALQEAIESCDINIVKAVVEKLNDIEHLRISPDEDSPVYYAISRYVTLYKYMNDPTFKIKDGNINYNNLDVPGLTKEDKIRNMRYYESDSELAQAVDYMRMENSYGAQELWNSELIDIQNVCLYLIEQTKDQDGYYKITKDGNRVSSLLFAAESNSVEICRELIIYKADPNIYRPAFLERCIRKGSWDVLAMYLDEFSEQAKIVINETDNIFHLPLLKAFLQNFRTTSKYTITYFNHVIELFKKCGARY
jgi:hypothetical protein